jgi:cytochrome c556
MCSHSADEKPESTETGGDGGNTDATLEKIWENMFNEVT